MRSPHAPPLVLALLVAGCGRAPIGETVARLDESQARTSTRRAALRTRVDQLERRSAFLEGALTGMARRQRAAAVRGLAPAPEIPASTPPRPEVLPATPRGIRFGGELRLALPTDPPTLDPVRVEDTTSFQVGVQIMEGLLELDEDLNLTPVIAERWTVSPDRRTYTFHLRRGVKFHNGRELTAEDCVYSFARNLDPKALGVRTHLFDRILGYAPYSAMRRVATATRERSEGNTVDAEALQPHLEELRATDQVALARLGHPRPAETAALVREVLDGWAVRGDVRSPQEISADVDEVTVHDFLGRGLEAPDRYTFVVRLNKPFAPFLYNLPMVNAAIVPREEIEGKGEAFAYAPVGAGPFRFVSWEHDVSVVLEAFPDYFRGRAPVDRIRYRILPDAVVRLGEFEIGNLDAIGGVPDEKYPAIKAAAEAGTYPHVFREYPLLHVFYLGLNPNQEPFTDVRVRRAFNHAVNKQLIVDKVRKGRGVVARGPLPPSFPAFDPELEGYGFDPDKARELLADAAEDAGGELEDVTLWFNTATGQDANAKIAEVVQAQMADVGVSLGLNGMAWGTYLDRVHRCEPAMFRLAWLPSHPNGDGLLYALFRHDDAKRISLYRAAQRRIVEDAVWIPIFHATQEFLARKELKGVRLNARGADAIRWRTAWFEG
jgi:peptide/nickel transport system substrate-binding protein/oligopeptide transport system substrate-binding protein